MASSDPLTPQKRKAVIFWFRRDLRLEDNTALNAALASGLPVQAIFIFDPTILEKLKFKDDRRVTFIYRQLQDIDEKIRAQGGGLRILYGKPLEVYKRLFSEEGAVALYCNEDYEPYARERDAAVQALCRSHAMEFHSHKDQVIFSPHEVLKDDGTAYNVFTPYSRRWLARFEERLPVFHPGAARGKWLPASTHRNPTLEELGFAENSFVAPPATIDESLIESYAATRDLPAIQGTSRLGLHLRFGTLSIRELALKAHQLSPKFLTELIWREFYQMIIWYYPHTVRKPFRQIYQNAEFPGTEKDFKKWAAAETGYALVDAGIRELVATGFMHNRVRMVVASFLTKHLLCDWRWGEHFFAQHLLDYELASNVGGWQWSAGVGVDAAPYFRIFNPAEQQKKFDPQNQYVNRWLKADNFFGTASALPMIDHKFARERCLKFFSTIRP